MSAGSSSAHSWRSRSATTCARSGRNPPGSTAPRRRPRDVYASSVTSGPEMPVAVYRGKGEIAVDYKPVPQPGPGEVLVEVSHCGVCGTDLHMVLEGWGSPGAVGGHEWSGRIAAVGPDVDSWSVGARVVGGELLACGDCVMCRAGRPSVCEERPSVTGDGRDGAFAQYVVTAARGLSPVADGVSLRTAALTEPLAVAMHAVTRSGVDAGDRVLVTGAGPIGLLAIAALGAQG